MQKTLHRITERGVYEIPDYDYIKNNSPVDLNRCDSILLSGENKDGSGGGSTDSRTLKNLEAITEMDSNTNTEPVEVENEVVSNDDSDKEKLIRPQSSVLDIETSKVIENPIYMDIPR